MKNRDFKQSFIVELVFVALVTIVSMISVRLLLTYYMPLSINNPKIHYTHSEDIKD
jgi:hypothetical protein